MLIVIVTPRERLRVNLNITVLFVDCLHHLETGHARVSVSR